MSAHTPTPWRIEGATLIWSPTGAATVAACGAPRSSSFVEYQPADLASRGFDEACANAARIVHCVNNFDALVIALRKIDDLAVGHVAGAIGKAQQIARAALRAAEKS